MAKTNQIVKEYTLSCMSAGLIPVPIIDLNTIATLQIRMINELCKEYGVEFNESRAKYILCSFAEELSFLCISIPIVSILKNMPSILKENIPIIGESLDTAQMASLTGELTYTLGEYLITHFEKGSTLEDIEPSKEKEKINNIYERSKEMIKNI